jgi:hypothetical protein
MKEEDFADKWDERIRTAAYRFCTDISRRKLIVKQVSHFSFLEIGTF